MRTVNALAQISALFEILEQEGFLSHADRCLLEAYVPNPGYDILWKAEEMHNLLKRISDYCINGSYETRMLDILPRWSQETLARLRIALTDIEEPRRSFLFFIMMEAHWSCL